MIRTRRDLPYLKMMSDCEPRAPGASQKINKELGRQGEKIRGLLEALHSDIISMSEVLQIGQLVKAPE